MILHHNSLEDHIRTNHDEEYDIVSSSVEYSAVVCRLSHKEERDSVTTIGKTCRKTLRDTFVNAPTLTVSQSGVDHAGICYLNLPVNT